MGNIRTDQVSFGGGEITPEMYGRVDDVKYQSGLSLCKNFIIKPWGPAANRAGTKYVRAAKYANKHCRLISFTFSTTQTMAIETGEGYFRFHTNAGTLLSGSPTAWSGATAYTTSALVSKSGINYYCIQDHTNHSPPNATYWYPQPSSGEYEVPNFYAEADLFDIHYVQSADVMSLVHPNYQPVELQRLGATQWKINPIQTSPRISAPSPTGNSGTPITQSYVVTAVTQATVGSALTTYESIPSSVATCSNDLTLNALYDLIAWATVAGATGYNIYRSVGGVYTYIGTSNGTSFVDDSSIVPQTGKNPPTVANSYVGAPGSVTATAFDTSAATVTATATVASGAINLTTQKYVVTAVSTDSKSESTASTMASCSNNLFATGSFNTIAWPAVSGASAYNVYKYSGGVYGYIGQTSNTTSLVDDDITADISRTPRNVRAPFIGANNYPGAISYYEQRRTFGGTIGLPQNIWMTRSGTESDLSYALPSRDDDGIVFRVAAREANTIRHIVPLTSLILLTSSAEWRVTSLNSDAITPTSVSVSTQSYIGASNVQPVVVNNNLIYAAARGGHLREMAYSWQSSGFVSGDLSLRAPHLFDNLTIVDMAYMKSPIPVVWAVSSNGRLLGCTYVPEQQVGPFHQHVTSTKAGDSVIESICVVAEGSVDVVYLVVNRTINSAQVRLIEWMGDRAFDDLTDAYFVDCGAVYSGAPATAVSGLSWLEGETVNILADGAVCPQVTVTGGVVTIPEPASVITVGLPIIADLETLPVAFQVPGLGQGRQKNVNKVWLRVNESSGVYAGPSFDKLTPAKQRTTEPYGSPPNLKTGEIPIMVTATWGDSGTLCVRQSDPLPLTLVSMALDVSVGA